MNRTLLALLIAVAPAVLMAQLPEYVPTENLVGWYPFDGDAENFGGTSSDGTVYGATAAVNRFDDVNSALSFDGSNDYVEIPHSEELLIGGGSATWAFWCKIPNVSHGLQSPLITNYVTPTTPLFGMYVGGVNEEDYEGRVQIHYRTNSAGSEVGCQSDFRVDDSNWHHIAGVLDADQDSLLLYIDGILAATRYALAGSPDSYQSIVLGGNHLGRFFEVAIDDVGIWSQALSAGQIQTLFEAEINACFTPLELQDVTVLSAPTSRYAEDGVIEISVSNGQPASLSLTNQNSAIAELIPFAEIAGEMGAGSYSVSVIDTDGCSSDTLSVIVPYELCCECGVSDVDSDGICDDEDNCADRTVLNYADPNNADCYECQNGILEPGEICDDGNPGCGDGCCNCKEEVVTWQQIGSVIEGAGPWDSFGENVIISRYGNRILASSGGGAVRAYKWSYSNEEWEQEGNAVQPSPFDSYSNPLYYPRIAAAGHLFSFVLGWRQTNENRGSVGFYGYHHGEDDWVEFFPAAQGLIEGEGLGYLLDADGSGSRVAVSGNVMNGPYDYSGQHYVRVYQKVGSCWTCGSNGGNTMSLVQLGEDIIVDGMIDDISMSEDGMRLAIAHGVTDVLEWSGISPFPFLSNNYGDEVESTGSWSQVGQSIQFSGNSIQFTDDLFDEGSSIAMYDTPDARVYHLVGNNWVQKGSNISTGYSGWGYTTLGGEIRMSGLGSILAIGRPGGSHPCTNSGGVDFFKWYDDDWQPMEFSIPGTWCNHHSGWSISMTRSGMRDENIRIVVGAPYYDAMIGLMSGGTGGVHVYQSSGEILD